MRAPNLLVVHARHLLGRPLSWDWVKIEIIGEGTPKRSFKVVGAIFPQKHIFGPRAGTPDFSIREASGEVIIPEEKHRLFIEAWERETGLCHLCGDTGEVKTGMDQDGPKYGPCERCHRGNRAQRGHLVSLH